MGGKGRRRVAVPSGPLGHENGLGEIQGVDGVSRVYSFSSAGNKDNPLYLAIGVSKRVAFGRLDKTLTIDLALLLLVTGLCLLVAGLFDDAAILRPDGGKARGQRSDVQSRGRRTAEERSQSQ